MHTENSTLRDRKNTMLRVHALVLYLFVAVVVLVVVAAVVDDNATVVVFWAI